jgi:exosortase
VNQVSDKRSFKRDIAGRPNVISQSRFIVPLLIASGYLPLLWWHFASLLERPHYQFVVVVPILIWALLRSSWSDDQAARDFRWTPLVLSGAVVSLLLLALATWVWSPWIATLSSLGTGYCVCWSRTGWKGMSKWFRAWLMGWILLPPPFGWDERLTVILRGLTTRATSRVLDLLAVLHVSYMNVIQVPQKSLFIADACSGVHSLFVLLAAALFWSLWFRRSVIHAMLLLIATVGIVLLENISRLVVIVLGLSWRIDLSSGIDHTALGLLLFAVSAGLIMSTDQLLAFILPQRLNRPFSVASSDRRIQTVIAPTAGRVVLAVVSPVFGLCGIAQWMTMPGPLPDVASSFKSVPDLKVLGQTGMPYMISEFSQADYSLIRRVMGDPFGQQSQQWVYRRDPVVTQISVDYPYDGIHDATECYTETGWTIEQAEIPRSVAQSGTDYLKSRRSFLESAVVVRMSRPLEGNVLLVFSQFDQNGTYHAGLKHRAAGPRVEDAQRRFASFLNRSHKSNEAGFRAPLVQVQMLARSAEPFTEEDLQRLLTFYGQFRDRARQNLLDR